MRILDEAGHELQEEDVDLELGYLEFEQLFVKHHDEVQEQPEVFHYECRTFYFEDDTSLDVSALGNEDPHVKIVDADRGVFEYVDQGEGKLYRGLDIEQVIDQEKIEHKDAWDEYEDIQRYKLYTEEQLAEKKKQEEAAKKQQEFFTTGPDRLSTAESDIVDVNIILAEMIGA